MSVKNILAVYSGLESKKSGLLYAIKLANLTGAWITGALGHDGKPIAEERFKSRLPSYILKEIHEIDVKHIEDIVNRFETTLKEHDLLDRSTFYDLEKSEVKDMSALARAFDLVIMGPHSKDEKDSHLSAYPDRVALQSGRPVLIVPNDYVSEDLASHALVAWDGKRASARALADAMSILENKPKLTILSVGEKPLPGTDILLTSLERHGADANLLMKRVNFSIANTILETAEEINSQLIVMGAYEHSKFAQDIFGGVTHSVIKETKIPVLLSH